MALFKLRFKYVLSNPTSNIRGNQTFCHSPVMIIAFQGLIPPKMDQGKHLNLMRKRKKINQMEIHTLCNRRTFGVEGGVRKSSRAFFNPRSGLLSLQTPGPKRVKMGSVQSQILE